MYGIENKKKIFLFEDAVVSFSVMRTIQFFLRKSQDFEEKIEKKTLSVIIFVISVKTSLNNRLYWNIAGQWIFTEIFIFFKRISSILCFFFIFLCCLSF